ncbi:hypothetical protein PQX77_008143 [Marasmius sp. AFHP31]|nr:hypothetical protein PQX77_008143 [Marasmius sp. AFHP31]
MATTTVRNPKVTTQAASSSTQTATPGGSSRPNPAANAASRNTGVSKATQPNTSSLSNTNAAREPVKNKAGKSPNPNPTAITRENNNEQPPQDESSPSASTRASLFGREEPVVSSQDILEETNRAAVRLGKKPLPVNHSASTALAHESTRPPSPSDQVRPEDSISQVERWSYPMEGWSEVQRNTTRPLPSVASRKSQRIESQVRGYHIELRRRYVLQMLREHDLLEHSTTYINEQDISVDEERNVIYHTDRPQITQCMHAIADSEVEKLRSIYPEPFSKDDPNPHRRSPVGNTPGGSGGPPSGSYGDSEGNGHNGNNSGNGGNRPPPKDGPGRPGGPPGGDGGPPDDPGYPSDDDSRQFDGLSERGDTGDQQKGIRYTSVDPTLVDKRQWTYDPTPQSQDEMLLSAFKVYEELILTYLFCEPVATNASVQKTLLQSIPKPGEYSGDDDLTVWDSWFRDLVRWMNTAGLCGNETRWSENKMDYVLTSVDLLRTNTLAAFLKGAAKQWLHDIVERIPDNRNEPLNGRWTFMQVVAGLF